MDANLIRDQYELGDRLEKMKRMRRLRSKIGVMNPMHMTGGAVIVNEGMSDNDPNRVDEDEYRHQPLKRASN